MIIGDVSRVHVISLKRDDKDQIDERTIALIDSFDASDKVYILTDMMGSSVNNSMVSVLSKRASVSVIAGMNFPLILEIALSSDPLPQSRLDEIIAQSRAGIQDVAALLAQKAQEDEEDDL